MAPVLVEILELSIVTERVLASVILNMAQFYIVWVQVRGGMRKESDMKQMGDTSQLQEQNSELSNRSK